MPRAGLTSLSVTVAGATLADEVGFDQLSMGLLAERLGVKAPSLYKHLDSLADLAHRIAVLATIELGDTLRDATQGRAGHDALIAAARAWRTFVTTHPGRYTAANNARATGVEDPLAAASERLLASVSAVLGGYHLAPEHEIHALRVLRSALHGFATLEVAGGFQYDTDVEESFTWMVALLDKGLKTAWEGDRTQGLDVELASARTHG